MRRRVLAKKAAAGVSVLALSWEVSSESTELTQRLIGAEVRGDLRKGRVIDREGARRKLLGFYTDGCALCAAYSVNPFRNKFFFKKKRSHLEKSI